MSEYSYKPRLGFDIRVKPPKNDPDPPVWARASKRVCDAPDCRAKAAVRALESPRKPGRYLWLCTEHAAQHNRKWNFFEGLSDSEAEAVRVSSFYGDRPTWGWKNNDRARASGRVRGPAEMADAFGLFRDATASKLVEKRTDLRDGRRLTRLQVKAFATLMLPISAPGSQIRQRYAELLKRFHPDANNGDRSAEEQLQEVVRAHQILKKARIC